MRIKLKCETRNRKFDNRTTKTILHKLQEKEQALLKEMPTSIHERQ